MKKVLLFFIISLIILLPIKIQAQAVALSEDTVAVETVMPDTVKTVIPATKLQPAITNKVDTLPLIPTVVLVDEFSVLSDTIEVKPSMMYLPIIFIKQQIITDSIGYPEYNPADTLRKELDFNYNWLTDDIRYDKFQRYHMNRVIYQSPEIVRYNLENLPKPPKQSIIEVEPNKLSLDLNDLLITENPKEKPDKPTIKYKSWINDFVASVQFSQAYLSDNWYQGGNSHLNLYGSFVYSTKLNQNLHPNLLFENTIQYKISLSSAPNDSLRSYSISEDLLQINTKFGIKAVKKWYYTMTMQFKTQVFNNFKANTNDLATSFLTPGELNLGFGMTFSDTNKKKTMNFNASIAPVSYNMKICRQNIRVNPEQWGIDKEKHLAHQVGSNIEAKLNWTITPNITFNSRFYVFTNYEYLQGDWENNFNFSINKYLSTQFNFHLRYDTSAKSDPDWKKWQFKEILSFGFFYKI